MLKINRIFKLTLIALFFVFTSFNQEKQATVEKIEVGKAPLKGFINTTLIFQPQ